MFGVVRDYFSVNGSRMLRGFFVLYFMFLLATISAMFENNFQYRAPLVFLGITVAFFWAIAIALLVIVSGSIDAWLKISRLARGAGQSVSG